MAERSVVVRLSARAEQYTAAMASAKASTAGFSKEAQSGLTRLGGQMTSVGRTMSRAVTLPLVGAGLGALKLSSDFETSMSKIQGLVGLSADEVDGMRDSVMSLAGETARAPGELADALFFITSAGLEGQDALDALESSAKASAVGLGQTAVVADLVTSAMNAYGSEMLSAGQATDDLTMAVRLGKLEPDSLAAAMGRVLPVASAMGVEFHEVGAAFAAMSRTGTNANEAASQLRGILSGILSPSAEARTALAEVGLTVEAVQASLRDDGLLATLEMLVEAMGGNATAAEAVFGNIRALSGVMDMLGSNVDATRSIFDEMTNTAGVTNEAFEIMADTAGFKMRQAWSDIQATLIQAGDIIMPVVLGIVDAVSGLMRAFGDLPRPVQTAVIGFLAVVAAVGPLLRIGGAVVKNLSSIGVGFTKLGTAARGASAMLGGIGILVAGAAAMYLAYSRNKQKATERTNEFVTALELEADGHTNATDELIAAMVATENFRKVQENAGISASQMAGFIRGETVPAIDELIRAADGSIQTQYDWSQANDVSVKTLIKVADELKRSRGAYEESTAQVAAQGAALDELTEKTGIAVTRDEMLANQQTILAAAVAAAQSELLTTADATDTLADATEHAESATDLFGRTLGEMHAKTTDWEKLLEDAAEAAEEWEDRVNDATTGAADSFGEFNDEMFDSAAEFRDALNEQTSDLAGWQTNLIKIFDEVTKKHTPQAAAEFTGWLAEMGAAGAPMVAELAGNTDELAAMYDSWVLNTSIAERDMAAEFAKVSPEFARIISGIPDEAFLSWQSVRSRTRDEAVGVGAAVGDGIKSGMEGARAALGMVAVALVQSALNKAKAAAQIGSPSKLFADEVGEPIAAGIGAGINRGAADVSAAITHTVMAPLNTTPFVASDAGSTAVDLGGIDVRVFVGDQELTGIVRTEIRRDRHELAGAVSAGRR